MFKNCIWTQAERLAVQPKKQNYFRKAGKYKFPSLAQIRMFFKIFICICSAEMGYISRESFLESVPTFSMAASTNQQFLLLLAIGVYCRARHKIQEWAESRWRFFLYKKNMDLHLVKGESPGGQDKNIRKGEDNGLRGRTTWKGLNWTFKFGQLWSLTDT